MSLRLSHPDAGVGCTAWRARSSRKSWGRTLHSREVHTMASFGQQIANRRRFLQFLAGSPLLAASGLPAFAGEGPTPGTRLPDPLMWAPMRSEELIATPKE